MKKNSLLFIALVMALGSCSKGALVTKANDRKVIDFDTLESNEYTEPTPNLGTIGTFDLVAPLDGIQVEYLPTFTWTEAENATRYSLEICSDERFISKNEAIDYYIINNLTCTTWTPTVTLAFQNTTYYWRVLANNGRNYTGDNIPHSEVRSFYVVAPEIEEFQFDLGEADDWQLHPTGSYADIAVDNSNFFGNDQESIAISFKKEDTMRGIPESDGWIVVTKTIEKSIYGTDAIMFDMYYSGQDADVFIRLIDRDNEFWVAPVKLSVNAKQKVFLEFKDFVQRTADVTVANNVFDHDRIKYLEIVFERSFGDGILLISNVKAVKIDNYHSLFIDQLNFNDYTETQWVNDTYDFEREVTDDELTIKYWSGDGDHPSINSSGYGFAKIYVNQYLYGGDAIKLKVKYSGNKGNNIVVRVYEEDTDLWFYRIPYSSLTEGEYKEVMIPFKAFAKSSLMGDGRRQFYFVINLQFGIEGQYGTGTASYKDFEVVKTEDYRTEEKRAVDGTGLIENFNQYTTTPDLYLIWDESYKNKDEYMSLNSNNKVGGADNPYCGQFEYKADMEPAVYELPLELGNQTFESLSIWLKDASILDSRAPAHIDEVIADLTIYLELAGGEIYGYHLTELDKVWREYVLPFDSFELTNIDYLPFVPTKLKEGKIVRFALSFQYFYLQEDGKTGYALYTDDNKVYADNICFGHDSIYQTTIREKLIEMTGNVAIADDFESYADTAAINEVWVNGSDLTFQSIGLSNQVSSEGGTKAMSLRYKCDSDSPKYFLNPAFAKDVTATGVRFSLACNKSIKVFFNLYFMIGSSVTQYRYTIESISTAWTEYTLSFDRFEKISGSTLAFDENIVRKVYRISFGAQRYDNTYAYGDLLVDNIVFDKTIEASTNSTRTID